MADSKLMTKPLPVDLVVALYDFDARDRDELTIKEGQVLCLEDKRRTDEWARVRRGVAPSSPSGLVPWTYVESKKPLFRASALYKFARQKNDEPDMALGQTMSVYGSSGSRCLVKLDDFNGRVGWVGFVPENYVEEFQLGEAEKLGPMSLKALPEQYCNLCEGSLHNSVHYECTQCRLPNGNKYFICHTCADDRHACVVHQLNKGQTHLFSRRSPPNIKWICSICSGGLEGTKSFLCVSCPNPSGDNYEMCLRCFSDPKVPRHHHPLIAVSPENVISQSHLDALIAQPPSYQRYLCDGCRREISRFVLNCKRCPPPGYDLCPECAELDRAAYLHDRWTGGAPHEFEIIDCRLAPT